MRITIEFTEPAPGEGVEYFLDMPGGRGNGPFGSLQEAIGEGALRCIRRMRTVRVYDKDGGAIPVAIIGRG